MSISGPIAPYSNVPIHANYYKPKVFDISDITRGKTTTVTTSTDHDYVVGQEVRFRIPSIYGMRQINGQLGFVLSIPSTTQVVVDIDSSSFDAFIPTPYTATITNATQAAQCVLTTNNYFKTGNPVYISGVSGMEELNGNYYNIVSCNSTTITLNVDSTEFTAYTADGTVQLAPLITQPALICAIGDVNTGVKENSDINSITTYIPGSFINIS